jgi:hypothetical protein
VSQQNEPKLSPTVQAARDRQQQQQEAADLRRKTASDLARLAFGAPDGFQASDQDVDALQRALAQCYVRHRQRQAIASGSTGDRPPHRRFSTIASRF